MLPGFSKLALFPSLLALGCWLILLGFARGVPSSTERPLATGLSSTAVEPVSPPEVQAFDDQLTCVPDDPILHELNQLTVRQQRIQQMLEQLARREDQLRQQSTEQASLQRTLTSLQDEISRLHQEIAAIEERNADEPAASALQLQNAASPATPVLITKLYRPVRLSAAELRPLVEPLLTQGTGFWSSSVDGETDVILVRDVASVIADVDRLVAELDRPWVWVDLSATVETSAADGTRRTDPIATLSREGDDFVLPLPLVQEKPSAESHLPDSRQTSTLRLSPKVWR